MDGVSGEDESYGVDRQNFFALWPEFSGREEDLDRVSQSFDEMREFCKLGFDSTRYACEILKRTIQWNFESAFRNGADVSEGLETKEERTYGCTTLPEKKGQNPPFRILIQVSLLSFYVD